MNAIKDPDWFAGDDGYRHKCIVDEQKLIACPSHGETCRATQCVGCKKIVSDCGEFDE